MKEHIFSDDFEVSDLLKIHAGLRFLLFNKLNKRIAKNLIGSDDNYNIRA